MQFILDIVQYFYYKILLTTTIRTARESRVNNNNIFIWSAWYAVGQFKSLVKYLIKEQSFY